MTTTEPSAHPRRRSAHPRRRSRRAAALAIGAAVSGVAAVAGGGPVAPAAAAPAASGAPGPAASGGPSQGSGPALAAPAVAAPAGPVALPQLWRWPLLPAPRVLRAFDPPAKPWLPGHRGVDLAAFPGQPVLSAATGVVVFAGPLAGRGVVSVEYGGIRSSYEPVVPLVRPGDRVVVGEPVALVAPVPVHCRTRTCLHWGAFVSLSVPRRYLDPRTLVGAGPVRLVALDARRPLTGWAPATGSAGGPAETTAPRPARPPGTTSAHRPAAGPTSASAPVDRTREADGRPVGAGQVAAGAVAGLAVATAFGIGTGRLRRTGRS